MDALKVSAADFQRDVGRYQNLALTRSAATKGASSESVAYGLLPAGLVEQVRQRLVALLKTQQFAAVPRTE